MTTQQELFMPTAVPVDAALIDQARWAHHSNTEGQRYGVTLPAVTMARILGRKCPNGAMGGMFYADLRTGAIEFGTKVVWMTGARSVVDYVLGAVSNEDLDHGDYIEELMWRIHVRKYDRRTLDDAPIYWRDGLPMDAAARDAMLARQEAQRGAFAARGVLEGIWR